MQPAEKLVNLVHRLARFEETEGSTDEVKKSQNMHIASWSRLRIRA
jgi:hypothetical protein